MTTHMLQRAVIVPTLCVLLGSSGSTAQTADVADADYVVGPQDVITITSYDQPDLSGKFTINADGTFTYPLIGRFQAGNLTVRQLEENLKQRLKAEGFFRNPQVTAVVEQYKSRKIFIVGEVRAAGMYPLSGNMTLVEALARAGSTLPTSGGEVIVVHAGPQASGPTLPTAENTDNIERANLREIENGNFTRNIALRDGDTVLIPRAESIYVFGQVKNPGAYSLLQKQTTVLQALSIAGGVTDRGAMSRIQVIRIVNGARKELAVRPADLVQPGDTIVVRERFF